MNKYFTKFNNMFSLLIAITALIISLRALIISERQIDISDPSSSINITNIFLDITPRLVNTLFPKYYTQISYPILIEIVNTGPNPIVITNYYLADHPNIQSSSFVKDIKRKIYWSDNKLAIDVDYNNPFILKSGEKVLLKSSNSILINELNEYVSKIKNEYIKYFISDSDSNGEFHIDGIQSKDEKYEYRNLSLYLKSQLTSNIVKLKLETLNGKKLCTYNLHIDSGIIEESSVRLDFERILLDEFMLNDLKKIVEKHEIKLFNFDKYYDELTDILVKIGYTKNFLNFFYHAFYELLLWTPEESFQNR